MFRHCDEWFIIEFVIDVVMRSFQRKAAKSEERGWMMWKREMVVVLLIEWIEWLSRLRHRLASLKVCRWPGKAITDALRRSRATIIKFGEFGGEMDRRKVCHVRSRPAPHHREALVIIIGESLIDT